jgi:16S rRNA (cytosine1402-N4)-methyltransferase
MLGEVVELAAPATGRRILDCTLGLGGHSLAFLEAGAQVWGIDRDPAARGRAGERLVAHAARFTCLPGDYASVIGELVARGQRFDAVLADLGVSSLQLDDESRGFGIRSSAELDLRMGDGCPERAVELIERLSTDELADLIWRYGEERLSRKIAPALKRAVAEGRRSGSECAEAVRAVVRGHQQRHPAQRSFQALRIAVNDELGQLERLLELLPQLLAADGVAIVISFHSLEDRLVKNAFRAELRAGRYQAISKKVVCAGSQELAENPRAHSAKLRWARAACEEVAA